MIKINSASKIYLVIGSAILILLAIIGLVKNKYNSYELSAYSTPLPSDILSVKPLIESLPIQELSADEKSGLIYMREEEKLARDIYTALYEVWGINIFSNISQSEQTHMDSVKYVLTKYKIKDPVFDDSIGIFTDKNLSNLYTDLLKKGSLSIKDALEVGATIEDLDIFDLERYLLKTNNDDIIFVYQNLMRGSRNHLRSFYKQIEFSGETYQPQYINEKEFNDIISSQRETGGGRSGR